MKSNRDGLLVHQHRCVFGRSMLLVGWAILIPPEKASVWLCAWMRLAFFDLYASDAFVFVWFRDDSVRLAFFTRTHILLNWYCVVGNALFPSFGLSECAMFGRFRSLILLEKNYGFPMIFPIFDSNRIWNFCLNMKVRDELIWGNFQWRADVSERCRIVVLKFSIFLLLLMLLLVCKIELDRI